MKSKLAIFVALFGWGLFIAYIVYDYHEYGSDILKHFITLHPSETTFHLLMLTAPIGSTITAYLINERKILIIKIQQSEKKYRGLIENALVGVYKTNLKGDIIYANKAISNFLEFDSPEEMMRISILERYKNPKDRDILIENLKKIGEVNIFETDLLTKTGETKNVLLSATLEGDNISGIIMDITEHKKAVEKLRATYQKLKETQEQLIQAGKMAAMGQLAAGISHELNQPLTGVKGFAQSVLMDLEEDNPLREDLEKIVTQANKMDKIIQHVRLFARKSEFHMDEIDINQPIEDALMLLNKQLRVHNIRVKKTLSKNLPRIQGNSNQLEQTFLNIITNARDAIDSLKNPEGGEITIQSALSEDKKNIELTLKDTGCGISKEELGNIFNPFYTTKFSEGGMGLGLSIVYGIIESHKGSICVESKVGKETVFRIILPIA